MESIKSLNILPGFHIVDIVSKFCSVIGEKDVKAQTGLPAIFYYLNPGFPGQFSPIFQVFRHHFQAILIQFKNLRII